MQFMLTIRASMEIKITVSCPTPNRCTLLILVLFSFAASPLHASLSINFYASSCPTAELIVSNMVRSASSSDPTIPGKLLRLLFHDCFVEGCDASVLLQGNGTERSDPANTSLGGFSVIDSAKRVLEIFCPETVSCADIVALAARDAVVTVNSLIFIFILLCHICLQMKSSVEGLNIVVVFEQAGGPAFEIPTGRRDGRISDAANVRSNIVDTSFTMIEMIRLFNSKGLSLNDLVTLSGAHTIGVAHCNAFSDRFQMDSKGNLTLIDTSLDNTYAKELMKKCPSGSSASKTVNNDPETSFAFDNQYYINLLGHKGLFQSDSVLVEDERTSARVEAFANDQETFFQSWRDSFLKLTTIGVKTDDEGEIRQSCSFAN
ncbi:hypothetical protein Godav_016915 [Gossypium davidsonii]|uniref:Peroxidase n=2 Tax=Gossypium TaxID=3633 RepID=A0A7J8QSE1_GOSDV|nr:hypothetical protein [Gossypium davidsonii]MBA0639126.1 hypothetical protein [Gossypium klotzschianum]